MSIVLPSGSLSVVSFEMMFGATVVVASCASCLFAPECDISSLFLLEEFSGVPINLSN